MKYEMHKGEVTPLDKPTLERLKSETAPAPKVSTGCPYPVSCAIKHLGSAKIALQEALASVEPERHRKKLMDAMFELHEAEAKHLVSEYPEYSGIIRNMRKSLEKHIYEKNDEKPPVSIEDIEAMVDELYGAGTATYRRSPVEELPVVPVVPIPIVPVEIGIEKIEEVVSRAETYLKDALHFAHIAEEKKSIADLHSAEAFMRKYSDELARLTKAEHKVVEEKYPGVLELYGKVRGVIFRAKKEITEHFEMIVKHLARKLLFAIMKWKLGHRRGVDSIAEYIINKIGELSEEERESLKEMYPYLYEFYKEEKKYSVHWTDDEVKRWEAFIKIIIPCEKYSEVFEYDGESVGEAITFETMSGAALGQLGKEGVAKLFGIHTSVAKELIDKEYRQYVRLKEKKLPVEAHGLPILICDAKNLAEGMKLAPDVVSLKTMLEIGTIVPTPKREIGVNAMEARSWVAIGIGEWKRLLGIPEGVAYNLHIAMLREGYAHRRFLVTPEDIVNLAVKYNIFKIPEWGIAYPAPDAWLKVERTAKDWAETKIPFFSWALKLPIEKCSEIIAKVITIPEVHIITPNKLFTLKDIVKEAIKKEVIKELPEDALIKLSAEQTFSDGEKNLNVCSTIKDCDNNIQKLEKPEVKEMSISAPFDPLYKWIADAAGITEADASTIFTAHIFSEVVGLPVDLLMEKLGSVMVKAVGGAAAIIAGCTVTKGRMSMDLFEWGSNWLILPDPTWGNLIELTENLKKLKEGIAEANFGKIAEAFVKPPVKLTEEYQAFSAGVAQLVAPIQVPPQQQQVVNQQKQQNLTGKIGVV